MRRFWIVLCIDLFQLAGLFTIQGDRIDLEGSECWFRVLVPSDVFSSECQAYARSGLVIQRVRT